MDNEQQIKIIEEIFSNEENIKSIVMAQKKEDINNIFSQKGMDLTEDQFNTLKSTFKKLAEKLKSMSPEELEKVSGGGSIEDRAQLGGAMGAGSGAIVGLGAGVALGGVYAIIDTACRAKGKDSFSKNVWKVLGKTSIASLSMGAMGAVLGGAAGAAGGAVSGAYEDWSTMYGETIL